MSRLNELSYCVVGILLVASPALAGEPHTVIQRWQQRTDRVHGANHTFFLEVAGAIQHEGRSLNILPKQDDIYLRAGDVHHGKSYLLKARNTHSADPTELLAEKRDAKTGRMMARHVVQQEIFEAGKMPRRVWKEVAIVEQYVDARRKDSLLAPQLIKLLTAASPKGRQPAVGDRLRQETLTVDGKLLRSELTLFAGDRSATPVSVDVAGALPLSWE
ncbi:MAG: hypothetical protein JRH20_14305 [Deltaproteobacteria bacterium]|nr:hypothetical protein [Deltaproteobacteria bacterium]